MNEKDRKKVAAVNAGINDKIRAASRRSDVLSLHDGEAQNKPVNDFFRQAYQQKQTREQTALGRLNRPQKREKPVTEAISKQYDQGRKDREILNAAMTASGSIENVSKEE